MNCPDDAELAGFLEDALPRGASARVGAHVDGCPGCQARLDRLTARPTVTPATLTPELPDAPSGVLRLDPDTFVQGHRAVAALVGLPDVPGFEVLAEIGRGGMGVVFKARHRRLNRLVALKMILAGAVADPGDVQRFLFEAEVLARVQHPQIVQVFAADTFVGPNGVPIPYLAMELLEGGSLSRQLRATGGAGWSAPRAAARLVEGLARAVHAAHLRGVIHRDLKPGNVLFAGGPGGPVPPPGAPARGSSREPGAPDPVAKVMDFGLAKFTPGAGTGADVTQTGQVVGTPQYMAPEQATGAKEIGPAVDIYALGAILYECLSGRPPFVGADPVSVLLQVVNELPPDVRALRPGVPRDLAAVAMKCLDKDPARRYPSADALAADLRRFLDNRPTRARPVTTTERALFWVRRNPAVAGLCATLAAVLVAGFVATALLWFRAEDRASAADAAARRAERSERHAREEAERAAAALRDAQEQRALLEFRRAVTSCEEGRAADGLGLFARAVELAERSGQADLARAARVSLAAWPRELPPPAVPLPHAQQPRHVAYLPDGAHLVAAGARGELVLWAVAERKRVRTYKPPPNALRDATGLGSSTLWSVAVSPNGRTVAAGCSDGTLSLWDRDTEAPLWTGPGTANGRDLWSVAFASDTDLFANDGRNGLRKWDVSDRAKPKVVPLPPPERADDAEVQIVIASPDRSRVYSGDRNWTVREWDAATGKHLRAWRHTGWITDLAVSDDAKYLAATGPGGAWLVDLATGRTVRDFGLAGTYGNGIAFAPKRPYLVGTDGDGNVRFWHRDTGQPVGLPMRLHGAVARPRFRPGSDDFAVPAGGGVFLATLPDPPADLFATGTGRVRGLAWEPSGARVAVADESAVAVYDASGAPVRAYKNLPHAPLCVAWDPDPGRARLLVGTRAGFTPLELNRPGAPVADPAARLLGRVYRAAYHPAAGLFLATERSAARFDPAALRAARVGHATAGAPEGVGLDALAVRPDGREVLVAFADTVRVLDADTLEQLREWRTGGGVLDAVYAPDGATVVLARRDNLAEVLRADTGARAAPRALTHARAVTSAAVSPDGKLVLTGSRDGTARFWDAATGLPLGAPLRTGAAVTCVAFDPRGEHVLVGTEAGHVTRWDLPPAPAPGSAAELLDRFAPGAGGDQ